LKNTPKSETLFFFSVTNKKFENLRVENYNLAYNPHEFLMGIWKKVVEAQKSTL